MKVIESISDFRKRHSRCVVTIGKFDGVHKGHQAIVRQLMDRAAFYRVPAVVIVIEPHPEEFFADSPHHCPARLSEVDEKIALLSALGVDFVYRLRFDRELSRLSAETYVESILIDGFGVAALIVGDDFRFGYRRQGDFSLLCDYGARHGFEVSRTESCDHDGVRISSTRVREALAKGDFQCAEAMLGRPYSITARVQQGQQLGRDMGYPTCNLVLNRVNIPLHGVYACDVALDGDSDEDDRLRGAANIGFRPTVSDEGQAVLEVHLLDFRGDLYGETITVIFRHRIRAELKFETVDALQEQIAEDVDQVRAWFDSSPDNTHS